MSRPGAHPGCSTPGHPLGQLKLADVWMGNLHKGALPEVRWDVEDVGQPQELVVSPLAMRNSHLWPPKLIHQPWPRLVLGHEDQGLLSVPLLSYYGSDFSNSKKDQKPPHGGTYQTRNTPLMNLGLPFLMLFWFRAKYTTSPKHANLPLYVTPNAFSNGVVPPLTAKALWRNEA